MLNLYRSRTIFRRSLRRGLTVAAAVSFLCASVGVCWTVGPTKDQSIAFPCMLRPCGCRDAASCKEHCCCFSDEQKLAWAAEHHVDPTPFVRKQSLRRFAADDRPPARAPKMCCSADLVCASVTPIPVADALRHNSQTRLLSITAFRECHGLSPHWSALVAALPAPGKCHYQFEWTATGTVALLNVLPIHVALVPPIPPPRG